MKRICCLAIAVLLCVPFALAGCKKQVDYSNDPSILHINMWKGGYGIEWMEALGAAFSAKKNGEITVKIDNSTLRDKANIPLTAKSVYDLIVVDNSAMAKYAINPQIPGYDKTFHNITDVFNYTPDGESKPIKDKLPESIVDWCDIDGENYYVSVSSSLWGLTYNIDLVATAPRTTNEMVEVFNDLKARAITPHIFSGYTDYWSPIVYTWWAQYDGLATFENFFKGMTLEGEYLYDIFATTGRYKALEATETFLKWGSGYYDQDAVGYQYMPAQLKYLQGESAFMANGGWLENEMQDSFKNSRMANIKNMRVPVLSAITERFADSSDKSDAKLREIIDYVDNGKTGTKPAGVSDDDIKIVEDARSLTYMTGAEMTASIPIYTRKEELAKEFLKFILSDEGAKIVLKANVGMQIPINTDFSSDAELQTILTSFGKSRMEILSSSTNFFRSFRNPIVYDGGLGAFAIGKSFERAFASPYENDRTSALAYYEYDINYFSSGNQWNNLLKSVGLID